MSPDHFTRFFPAICAGFGLFLVGGANLALLRRGVTVRVLATVAACGVALAAAWLIDQPGSLAGTARLLGLGLLPIVLLGSPRVFAALATAFETLKRPAVGFGLLTVGGVALAVGSILVYESEDRAAADAALGELEEVHGKAPNAPTNRMKAVTDKGTLIVLKEALSARPAEVLSATEAKMIRNMQLEGHIIRRGPVGDRANCHGWVFTHGQFILSPDDVELILRENGYQEVFDPQPGDVAVYGGLGGNISHTAIVRANTPAGSSGEGRPLLVEGKWGNLGVFLHYADKSPYGNEYRIYRSTRPGHLLAGVGGPIPSNLPPGILAAAE